ncbi:MAG: DinB family protein [Bryobacterales bacterium]|nr:DinB family protein [Bryobacterales bacterium]
MVKHLRTSRDFTLKVADQMPAADYAFKLTAPQMTFAEQMIHLSKDLDLFMAPIVGEKPNPGEPSSAAKRDVLAFIRRSFDRAIERVSTLSAEQISTTYKSEEGTMTGLEMLMGMLDHTTHHRASVEMYLRAKGIVPAAYQF